MSMDSMHFHVIFLMNKGLDGNMMYNINNKENFLEGF